MHITRRVEFDAGHRIPFHGSKCRGNHGHRYVVEATIFGPVKGMVGESDDGMVMDFGKLKDLLTALVAEPWDHATLCWDQDMDYLAAMHRLGNIKTVILPLVPTAENLAIIIYGYLHNAIRAMDSSGDHGVERVRVWETPNCYADCLTLGGS